MLSNEIISSAGSVVSHDASAGMAVEAVADVDTPRFVPSKAGLIEDTSTPSTFHYDTRIYRPRASRELMIHWPYARHTNTFLLLHLLTSIFITI